MIPTFPAFKKLEITDKEDVEKLTLQFPPYSDYNFVSLWSYNVEDDIVISTLNGNLIVRFRDYITNEPFFSFIGAHKISETVLSIFTYAQKINVAPTLKLVPESSLKDLSSVFESFHVKEDVDNHDYVYSTKELSALEGAKYAKKRNLILKFKKEYVDTQFITIDVAKSEKQNELLKVFDAWEESRNKQRSETEHELVALKRLLQHAHRFDLIVGALLHKNSLIGFTITERVQNIYAMTHFTKANIGYRGVNEMLYHNVAKELFNRGCLYINREQDLGIPGLRMAKSQWNPIHFLKKYTIQLKDLTHKIDTHDEKDGK